MSDDARSLFFAAFLTVVFLIPAGPARARLIIDDDDPVAKQDLEAMLTRCEEESPAFHDIMETVRQSSHDVHMDPVRGHDADGIFVDGFNSGRVDLDDLDGLPQPTQNAAGGWDFPPGVSPQAFTRCQALVHVVWERYFANFVGGQYEPSHVSANDIEERVRRDYGQEGGTVDHTGQDGNMTTVYRNSSLYVEDVPIAGGDDVGGPPVTTAVAAICVAKCGDASPRMQFGADSCDACRARAAAYCTAQGQSLGDFACRTNR